MKTVMKSTFVLALIAGLAGCVDEQPNTFKLVGELPPNFYYSAVAWYVPDPEKTCAVTDWRRTMPSFNRDWRKQYDPVAVIEIRKVIKGCQMILNRVRMKITGVYGEKFHQSIYEYAGIGVYPNLDEQYKRTLAAEREDTFYGKCEWLFRTMGPERNIRKILGCKKDLERGERGRGKIYAVYTLDQLAGKTIRMNVRLAEKERPYFKDTWVEFDGGWRRCLGEGMEDLHAYCWGDYKSFSKFVMPDGRVCSIYPGCEE